MSNNLKRCLAPAPPLTAKRCHPIVGRHIGIGGMAMQKIAGLKQGQRQGLAARLSRIEGQVRGLRKMVEEDRYCVDLLMQVASVQEALRGASKQVMRHYLQTCATKAIQGRNRDGIYDELMDVIYKYVK